ncbi:MAG: DUF971 domain-containing protein [Hyphomicrobiales bacterium]
MKTLGNQNADEAHTEAQGQTVDPPIEIRRQKKGAGLTLIWPDGIKFELSAAYLRDNSQSAGAKRLKLRGLDVPASQDIFIEGIKSIGSYALNIVFSDGHDRGIYPWVLLRQLSENTQGPVGDEVCELTAKRALTVDDFLICN